MRALIDAGALRPVASRIAELSKGRNLSEEFLRASEAVERYARLAMERVPEP
jgi:hypothetical protein